MLVCKVLQPLDLHCKIVKCWSILTELYNTVLSYIKIKNLFEHNIKH